MSYITKQLKEYSFYRLRNRWVINNFKIEKIQIQHSRQLDAQSVDFI